MTHRILVCIVYISVYCVIVYVYCVYIHTYITEESTDAHRRTHTHTRTVTQGRTTTKHAPRPYHKSCKGLPQLKAVWPTSMDYNKFLVAIKHPISEAEARWSNYTSNQQLQTLHLPKWENQRQVLVCLTCIRWKEEEREVSCPILFLFWILVPISKNFLTTFGAPDCTDQEHII